MQLLHLNELKYALEIQIFDEQLFSNQSNDILLTG